MFAILRWQIINSMIRFTGLVISFAEHIICVWDVAILFKILNHMLISFFVFFVDLFHIWKNDSFFQCMVLLRLSGYSSRIISCVKCRALTIGQFWVLFLKHFSRLIIVHIIKVFIFIEKIICHVYDTFSTSLFIPYSWSSKI